MEARRHMKVTGVLVGGVELTGNAELGGGAQRVGWGGIGGSGAEAGGKRVAVTGVLVDGGAQREGLGWPERGNDAEGGRVARGGHQCAHQQCIDDEVGVAIAPRVGGHGSVGAEGGWSVGTIGRSDLSISVKK
jgi:hypothetical protein